MERSGRSAHSEDAALPGLEVSLWERMLAPENLGQAFRRVRANRGAPGVDGMTTDELDPWLREHWAAVRKALGDAVSAANAWESSASMSRSLCTNRANTTFFLPEARVIGLVPA